MRRWMPLFLVFTTVAGLALWLFVRDREPPSRAIDRAEQAAHPSPGDESELRTPVEEPLASDPVPPVPTSTPEPAPAALDAPSEPAEVSDGIRGRVIVLDAEGVEHTSESGTMQLFVPTGGRGSIRFGHSVAVEDGAWNLSVAGGLDHVRELSVQQMRLGGREAVPEGGPFEPISVQSGEPVTIRARWKRGTLLHVVDAATGVSLDHVEVRDCRPYPYDDHKHPGLLHERVIVEGAASPVELEPSSARTNRSVFVRSPGYAWGVIALTPTGGDRTIELVGSGQLNIRLLHDTNDSEATLRIYESLHFDSEERIAAEDELREAVASVTPEEREQMQKDLEEMRKAFPSEDVAVLDGLAALLRGESPPTVLPSFSSAATAGPPVIEVPVEQRESVELDSIAPGSYVVRVELGRWYRNPTILAQEGVSVTAGGIAETELRWQAPVVPESGTIALTVACPVEWRECESSHFRSMGMASLRYRGQSAGSGSDQEILTAPEPREAGDVILYDFGIVEVPPGPHIASVGTFDYQALIEVPEGASIEHTIRIPEPARVVVSAVDVDTGQVVPVESLSWNPERPRHSTGGSRETVNPVRGTSRFEFCAPIGRIYLSLDGPYRVHRELEVVPGVNEVTLEASAVSKISFIFRDGDSIVPFDELAQIDADPLEGDGGIVAWGGSRIWVDAPGLYRVELPDLDGYAPIPPQEIRVQKEQDVERTIQLVRDRSGR